MPKEFVMSQYASKADLYHAQAIYYKGIASALAKFAVTEYYGGVGDRGIADQCIMDLGWEAGLSEDTYFDMVD